MEAEECWEPSTAGGGKDGFSLPPFKGAQPSQRCACYGGFPGGSVARIHLPVQETQVRYLIREDPIC